MENQDADGVVLIRTSGDAKKLTVWSRALYQRTCRHNATETYRYDARDGKLTGAEADISTWEERNTEIYRWLNDDRPPPVRETAEAADDDSTTAAGDDDAGLVRMASAVRRVAPLRWGGTNADRVVVGPERLRERAANIDGRQRSLSEHCVRMKSVVGVGDRPPPPLPPPRASFLRALPPPGKTSSQSQPPAARPPSKQQLVWAPPPKRPWAVDQTPMIAGKTVNVDGGGFGRSSGGDGGAGMFRATSLVSLAERHSKRCVENKKLKALHYRQGIDY